MRAMRIGLLAAVLMSSVASAEISGVVIKPTIDVYAEPKFESPKVATLKRDAAVTVTAQQGLWYSLKLAQSATGYVRVNDVRINYGKVREVLKAANEANFTGVAILTENQQAGAQIAQGKT